MRSKFTIVTYKSIASAMFRLFPSGKLGAVAFALLVPFGMVKAENIKVDPATPTYNKGPDLQGSLSSVGSDSLNNLMTLWVERFHELHPQVVVQVEGKGSGTAPPALIQGTAQLGPMSREMKTSEIDAFRKAFGFEPTRIRVAIDALGVFVNKDNPLTSISLNQLDAIFSKNRRSGAASDINAWGPLGISADDWSSRRISLYGRNSASGTYGFFKQKVLQEGDYKDGVKEQPGSSAVVQSIAVDRFGIGYSGIGYQTSGVKALALMAADGDEPVAATAETAYSGEYPLSRYLYVYVKKAPGKDLEPATREFLKFVLSQQGQSVVVKDGYYPLLATTAIEELSKIN